MRLPTLLNYTYLASWSGEKTVLGWWVGEGGWGWVVGSNGNKAKSALLKIELGLSLAISTEVVVYFRCNKWTFCTGVEYLVQVHREF